ncbi:MAG: RNA methyltransferase [Pirellulaceae bacterium]
MSQPITSPQNQRVKDAAKLRDARARKKQGRTIIDGAREIRCALAADVRVVELFVCSALCTSDAARQAVEQANNAAAEILEVTEAVFAKLAFGDRAEGVVAVAATPETALSKLAFGDDGLPDDAVIAVVEGVEKPGNLGAILRTADAAGVSALVSVGGGTDLYNPATIRASLGCVFTLPVIASSSDESIAWLRENGVRMLVARVDGSMDYTQADYGGRLAIALGSEAQGLSDAWRTDDAIAVRIPMLGAADSLNVSATAAVLFYEALRARHVG